MPPSAPHPLKKKLLARLPPLFAEKVWDASLSVQIEKADLPALVKAGLHLWNDDLERCHSIAQSANSSGENYWHALMHRREGDLENSLYWYQRAKDHPVIGQMKEKYPDWSPETFSSQCAQRTKEPDLSLEQRQAQEMTLLLEWSENAAT